MIHTTITSGANECEIWHVEGNIAEIATMESLDFLARRFQRIVPNPTKLDSVRADELRCWLRDDVGPVLADYVKRTRFRAQASWPLESLRSGADSAERRLVEAIDCALVEHGQAFRDFAKKSTINKQLENAAIENWVTEEVVVIGVDEQKVTARTVRQINRLTTLISQLGQIASRFWTDLVCPEDYFEPVGGWMYKEKSSGQPGEFIVAFNADLHPGGDFVSRCMCRRAEVIMEVLGDFHKIANKVFCKSKMRTPKAWTELCRSHTELTVLVSQLRHTCLEGDQQVLRDSCILLTQVYAALCPDADVSWLGLPETITRSGVVTMGHRLQSFHGELLERLAASLARLKKLYIGVDENQTAVDEAIASGALVLLRSAKQAFWEEREIESNWSRSAKMWRFLQTLAEKSRHGGVVVQKEVNDGAFSESMLPTLFSRLKKKLPPSLWKHIEPNADPKGYRLRLEQKQVVLFE